MTEIVDLVADSVIMLDETGVVRSWNAASVTLYGWSAQDAVGRRLEDLVRSDEALATEGEVRRRGRTGVSRFVQVRRETGANGTIEFGRDVTELRRLGSDLELSELRNRALLDALSAAVVEIDFSGVGALLRPLRDAGFTDWASYFSESPAFVRRLMAASRHLFVNTSGRQILGYGDDDPFPEFCEPVWPEESTADFARLVVATLNREATTALRTTLFRADGSKASVMFATCGPDQALRTGQVRVAFLDLTERLAIQRALEESERIHAGLRDQLAHASKVSLLGEFAATMAHEVNQPLAALSTSAGAALRWLQHDPPDLARARELMGRIAEDAARASSVVASVRAAAASRQPAWEPVALPGLVREVAHFLDRDFRGTGTTLVLDLDSCEGMVAGDRTQLQQLLVNLLTNALQAMDATTNRRREVRVRCEDVGDALVLTVRDTGPGFPPNMGASLFSSFFTTRPEGMGMGLAIARSICERHGGSIIGSSDGRDGAEFQVTLPKG